MRRFVGKPSAPPGVSRAAACVVSNVKLRPQEDGAILTTIPVSGDNLSALFHALFRGRVVDDVLVALFLEGKENRGQRKEV